LLLFLTKKKNLSFLFGSEEDFLTADAPRHSQPDCDPDREREPPWNKSLFASFSSEKEESLPYFRQSIS
jgi:hypothetical protein